MCTLWKKIAVLTYTNFAYLWIHVKQEYSLL